MPNGKRKQRINLERVVVKSGLGWIPSRAVSVTVWYVLIDGRTKATFSHPNDAWDWIDEHYELTTEEEDKP